MARGGKRQGAGRKSKSEEQKLAEKLRKYEPQAFMALESGLQDAESWAVKLFFEYMYGKPIQRQQVEVGGAGEHKFKGFGFLPGLDEEE